MIKDFLRNFIFLILIGIGLYFLFPETMGEVIKLYGVLFGPIAILIFSCRCFAPQEEIERSD